MTIANTDKILVNRSGKSYHIDAQNFDDVQDTDILLVNRAAKSYKCTRAELDAKLLDTDVLLINRNGSSYKVTGAEFKDLLSVLPEIGSITVTELTPSANRWTNQSFRMDCVMAEEGDPLSTKRITAYIEGVFAKRLITDTITGWDAGTKTLTVSSDQDLAPMQTGDAIRQNETSVIGTWQSFNADATNTTSGGANSAIAQDDTQTCFVGKGSFPLTTWVQRGPINKQGPWSQVEISNFVCRVARVYDDVLYIAGLSTDASSYIRFMASYDGGKTFSPIEIEGSLNGSISDFIKANDKYYLIITGQLYVADLISGPYIQILAMGT